MDADLIRARAPAIIVEAMQRWAATDPQWEVDDCYMAVANVVREITGKDPARRFRGRYRSRRGAMRLLGRGGGLKALGDSARALHWKRIVPAAAQPGDVALVELTVTGLTGQPVQMLGPMICRAPGWFVGRSHNGVIGLPAARMTHAWSIL